MKNLDSALKICKALEPLDTGKLPQEVLNLADDGTMIGIVVEVDSVDFILIMQKLPIQRKRPALQ